MICNNFLWRSYSSSSCHNPPALYPYECGSARSVGIFFTISIMPQNIFRTFEVSSCRIRGCYDCREAWGNKRACASRCFSWLMEACRPSVGMYVSLQIAKQSGNECSICPLPPRLSRCHVWREDLIEVGVSRDGIE